MNGLVISNLIALFEFSKSNNVIREFALRHIVIQVSVSYHCKEILLIAIGYRFDVLFVRFFRAISNDVWINL